MEECKISKIRCLKAETEELFKSSNGNKQQIVICEDYHHRKPALDALLKAYSPSTETDRQKLHGLYHVSDYCDGFFVLKFD